MKKILTVLLSLTIVVAVSQSIEQIPENTKSNETSKSFTEFFASGLPAPAVKPVEILPPAMSPLALTYYTDRTVFDADFPGLPIEGFENGIVAPGNIVSFVGPLDENTNNAYFGPGDVLPGIQIAASTGDIAGLGVGAAGNASKIFLPNTFSDSEIVSFNPPVTAVGFDVHDFGGGTSCGIDIYDALDNLLVSTSSPSSAAGVFFGVHSDTPIGKIIIIATTGQGVDNIAFGNTSPAVPVSNWAIVIGLLLIGSFIVMRYRKRLA